VGPTTGGVILAFETARQLGLPGFFAEEVRDTHGYEPGAPTCPACAAGLPVEAPGESAL
jgi:hypothetical protein